MPDIGFYIHHHGSGHFHRALSIAKQLTDYRITFFGSGLTAYTSQIPSGIQIVHLDSDYEENPDTDLSPPPDIFHYAPTGIAGLTNRAAKLVDWFVKARPCLLIIDVSVEITYLARLCGVPTIIVKLHGNRTDLPHLSAYQCARSIIAPYPKWMEDDNTPGWVRDKTLYSGGFSRFDNSLPHTDTTNDPNVVLVLLGSGGTRFKIEHLIKMATVCPEKQITVLGFEANGQLIPANLILVRYLANTFEKLKNAGIVIGSAGDNVVMEVAQLKKKFICVPEERPFNEQQIKAAKLSHAGLAIVVPDLAKANWTHLMEEAHTLNVSTWDTVINPTAIDKIAALIKQACQKEN